MPAIDVERDGRVAQFHGSWYRGEHTNFIPSKADLKEPLALDRYVLAGWEPPAPFIRRQSCVLAFGSCFAANVTKHLARRGYSVLGNDLTLQTHIIRFAEGMVSTHSMLQQFQWAFEGRQFPPNIWISKDKEIADLTPAVRDQTRRLIEATDVFVLTLGLSEIWYDKPSGEAFWRAIPKAFYDPERHGFRVSTVEENSRNIRDILDIIARARPGAKVVLTLSPVPLMATFRPISCITASSVSKAILRVGIDQVMSEARPNVHYFPSYEMVLSAYDAPFQEDNRHPRDEIVSEVMDVFERFYCLSDDGLRGEGGDGKARSGAA
ncbi:GSCFA domain-containing protein [Caulobacter sp. S45]|uniref:GSCFA domain-containing protein n=1 Tax=Caulobacter sp. S45 TaxID=1641861 RepID=UPI00157546E5|nr:GSCFA domain-containing protein [Caulobacter sp. S45]